MITEDYVSFEIAKLLKEKGFDSEDCFAFYNKNGEIGFLQTFGDITDYYDLENPVIAPTHQMAMKWLREVHDLWCEIAPEGKGLWCAEIYSLREEEFIPGSIIHKNKSYKESVEAILKYCLENLPNIRENLIDYEE